MADAVPRHQNTYPEGAWHHGKKFKEQSLVENFVSIWYFLDNICNTKMCFTICPDMCDQYRCWHKCVEGRKTWPCWQLNVLICLEGTQYKNMFMVWTRYFFLFLPGNSIKVQLDKLSRPCWYIKDFFLLHIWHTFLCVYISGNFLVTFWYLSSNFLVTFSWISYNFFWKHCGN